MRTAADILSSPAAMQIRQLEALQAMAKTASSKVVFVPMQLQGDVVGAMSRQEAQQGYLATPGASGSGAVVNEPGLSATSNAGLLESMANV